MQCYYLFRYSKSSDKILIFRALIVKFSWTDITSKLRRRWNETIKWSVCKHLWQCLVEQCDGNGSPTMRACIAGSITDSEGLLTLRSMRRRQQLLNAFSLLMGSFGGLQKPSNSWNVTNFIWLVEDRCCKWKISPILLKKKRIA